MTDKAIKQQAQRIKQAIHRHGTVHVFRDDEGKCHTVPGHDIELLAVYSEPVNQTYIESDLTPESSQ